jgi:hypothetical protein
MGVTQDTEAGRRVFRLQGKIPASNLVAISSNHSYEKVLGLQGAYLYVNYKVKAGHHCCFHFDFLMQDANPCRLTLTTLTTEPKSKSQSNGLIHLSSTGKWTIFCVDLDYTFKTLGLYPKTNLVRKLKFELNSMELCASSSVSGVFTSNNVYRIMVARWII